MANTNYSYSLDPFNGMQANRAQHLGGQQPTAGVPEQYLGPWSTANEQFRNSNTTVGGPQTAAAGHQVPPQHQMMNQGLGMMRNPDLPTQMLHGASRMHPPGMNPTNNFQQPQGQMSMPPHYANGMMNPVLGAPNNAMNQAPQQMGRNLFGSSQGPVDQNILRQMANIGKGVPNAPTMQRPSVSGAPQNNPLSFWLQAVQALENRIPQINHRVVEAINAKNINDMRQIRAVLPEQKKKVEEDRKAMLQTTLVMAKNGGLPSEHADAILRKREELANKMQTAFNHYEQLMSKLDDELQKLLQQQQPQPHLQHQQPPGRPPSAIPPNNIMGIPYPPDGRNSSAGMHPLTRPTVPTSATSQPWNSAQQNPSIQSMGGQLPNLFAQQNGPQASYQPNFGANPGGDAGNPQHQTPRLPQTTPQLGGQDPELKNNFYRFLRARNIDPNPIHNGRLIDLWTLYHKSTAFDKHSPPTHPVKFRRIGAELGFPHDENMLTDSTTASVLQEWCFRITGALNAMKGQQNPQNPQNPQHPQHPQHPQNLQNPPNRDQMISSDAAQNATILQQIKQKHPHIDFNSVTPDMINNFPSERFMQRLTMLVTEGSMAHNPMTTPQHPINNRTPTPNNNDQLIVSHFLSNPRDALQRQERFKTFWAGNFRALNLPPVESPDNPERWKQLFTNALTAVRMLLPSLGAFSVMSQAHGEQSPEEIKTILAASMKVVKQMFVLQSNNTQLGGNRVIYLRQQELEQMLGFLQPLAERHQQRMRMIPNPPPELRAMVHPTDLELRTFGGFLTAMLPAHPPQLISQTPNRTSTPNSMTMPTPGPSHPAPTPPHIGVGTVNRMRRNGISEAGAGGPAASPNHQTPSTVATPAAPTPPAAASPPKQQKVTRNKVVKPQRRTSRAANANTPTPAPEPASTPTPAATPSNNGPALKRSHDDTETPVSHPENPPNKRVKVEAGTPLAPVLPPTPPTPPPQISAPIDRGTIQNPEQALNLLTDVVKRSEGDDENSTQKQSPEEVLQWLAQLLSAAPASSSSVVASQPPAEVPTTNTVTATEADAPGELNFFDWGGYYSETETPVIPELDKHATVSPESHNDLLTKTPPSQNNGTAKAGASLDQASSASKTATHQPQSESMSFADATYGSSPTFPYDGPVEHWEAPWAID